jgi:hypothetical protein
VIRVDRHDVGVVGQMRLPANHECPVLTVQDGDFSAFGGDIKALCCGVVGQHVGAVADRVGAADPSAGDVDAEQGGVAVTGHKCGTGGWVEGQAVG